MASPEDYIVRFTDPARGDGELLGASFIIKPFTVNGPQHPSIDTNFTDPETGNATSRVSPIVLYGKGVPAYGEQMASNLLQLTENFAGASAPLIGSTPVPGITWFQDEKYWVNTATQVVYVWDDVAGAWVDITTLATTNSVVFDLAANRLVAIPAPVTGDYFFATDTLQLSMYFVWADYTPTIQAWIDRISRQEIVTPAAAGNPPPRRSLSVYVPTDNGSLDPEFVKMLSYRGNDAGDPVAGDIHVTGSVHINTAPTVATHAATKAYVDAEIAGAIGGNNQLHELLDVDPLLDATAGSGIPPTNGNFLRFDTSLADANVDGKWTEHMLVAADVTDFNTASDARIAAAQLTDLSDVNVTNGPGINGFGLVFNNGTGNWEASALVDTYVLADGELGGGPYTASDGLNTVVLARNDAGVITLDNIATANNYDNHVLGAADNHDSADVLYTGAALGVGTPSDVEQAIILLDAGITAAAISYASFYDGSVQTIPGNGEAPSNQFYFRSANNAITVALTDNDATYGDNLLLTFNQANITITESQISDLQSYLLNVVEDTTPQLGGNLDVNGQSIVSTSNGNINIQPNGSGTVNVHSLNVSNALISTTDASVTTLQTLTVPTNTVQVITVRAYGYEAATNDTIWAYIRFGVKNISGTVSIVGSTAADNGGDAGTATWGGITVAVSGATVLIRVAGEAAHNIDWECTTEVS